MKYAAVPVIACVIKRPEKYPVEALRLPELKFPNASRLTIVPAVLIFVASFANNSAVWIL